MTAAGAHQQAARIGSASIGDDAGGDCPNLFAGVEAQQPAQFAVLAVEPPRKRLPLAQAFVFLPEAGVFLRQSSNSAEIAADVAGRPNGHGDGVQNGSQQVPYGALDPVEDINFGLADNERAEGNGNEQGEHGPPQRRLHWRFGPDLRPRALLLQKGVSFS